MLVKSIDEYGIISRLKASKTQESKDALLLINATRRALERQKDLTKTAMIKLTDTINNQAIENGDLSLQNKMLIHSLELIIDLYPDHPESDGSHNVLKIAREAINNLHKV